MLDYGCLKFGVVALDRVKDCQPPLVSIANQILILDNSGVDEDRVAAKEEWVQASFLRLLGI